MAVTNTQKEALLTASKKEEQEEKEELTERGRFLIDHAWSEWICGIFIFSLNQMAAFAILAFSLSYYDWIVKWTQLNHCTITFWMHPPRTCSSLKIISQHQIIVQTLIFLFMTQTLVRMNGNIFIFFHYWKLAEKV